MRGASRESLLAGRGRLEAGLAARPSDALRVADELFGAVGLLAANARVRRALSDPARAGSDKATLVARLLTGRVAPSTLEVMQGLAESRWSHAGDLTEAVESLGVTAVLVSAERAERLDAVEDELFRFARVVAGNAGLRDALSYRTEGADRKAALVRGLLEGRAAPETVVLAVQAASWPRGLRVEQVLERFVDLVGERRSQLLAHVVVAVPPSEAQRERLLAALRRLYGRPVRLRVELDPTVLGGMRVVVDGEVVDGTAAARIGELTRRLAG